METSSNSIFYMSPAMRMVLFLALTGIGMIVGGFISFSIAAAILHVDLNTLQTILLLPEHSKVAQFANALASIIAFGIPSLVGAYFVKGSWIQNMGFNKVVSGEQFSYVVALAIAGLFLSGALGDLTEKIPLTTSLKQWAEGMEDQYKKALLAMTQMKSYWDVLFAILSVALIPAFMEELFFRASLQKILLDWSGKPYLSIVVTAIIFSAIHFSYFGFLSRMSLGIILGLVYYYTRTIWLPMLMHFIHNGIGVITLYWVRDDAKKVDAVINGNLTYYWVILAFILVYFLLKKLKSIAYESGLEKAMQ